MTKTAELKKIRDEVWHLTESSLYYYRQKNNYYPVLGEGSHNAKVMFIGEAPGENEAKTGRPFCGAAGKLLDELIESIGLKRQEVYITNIVKDRPPNNRDPLPEEIRLYAPFLIRQIEIIMPKVIATLGRFSMQFILEQFKMPQSGQAISKVHGQLLTASISYGIVTVIPLFHPAVALYNASQKEILFKDFQVVKTALEDEDTLVFE